MTADLPNTVDLSASNALGTSGAPRDAGYDLIACDMDGTLLDSDKRVTERTLAAIRRAVAAGKHVALCTGRALSEVEPYAALLEATSHGVLETGASIHDFRAGRVLFSQAFSGEFIDGLVDVFERRQVPFQPFVDGRGALERPVLDILDEVNMGDFRELFELSAFFVPDAAAFARAHREEITKINSWYPSTEARAATFAEIDQSLAEGVYTLKTTLEFSPLETTKGTGLAHLAKILGVARERTIAIGDSDNDLPMLEWAGLGIAMGNANDAVRAAADVAVASNDADGVAEAIERFLLGAA